MVVVFWGCRAMQVVVVLPLGLVFIWLARIVGIGVLSWLVIITILTNISFVVSGLLAARIFQEFEWR